ncbi:apolipoprotein D-like [Asterias amurensis]|uniref:apolipoprotein D-like n=1 Tax=Asterias amurensis TaxID=7602 RepID=UPI003AB1C483
MEGRLSLNVIAVVALLVTGAAAQLNTVKEVDVDAYVGRWFQVYGNFWSNLFADSQIAECTTADYSKINSTYVTVFNRYKTREGIEDKINGYAFIPDPREPGRLRVKLDGVPVESPYWIVKLGPIVNNEYTYAVVSDDRALALFMLVRDVKNYYALYDNEILEYLQLSGFIGPGRSPIKVYHGDDCEYLKTN